MEGQRGSKQNETAAWLDLSRKKGVEDVIVVSSQLVRGLVRSTVAHAWSLG